MDMINNCCNSRKKNGRGQMNLPLKVDDHHTSHVSFVIVLRYDRRGGRVGRQMGQRQMNYYISI